MFRLCAFCHLDHRINYGTGLCAPWRITKQPVAASYREGANGVLAEIVGKTAPSILKIGHKLSLVILGIVHRFLKTGSFLRSLLWDPFPECVQYRFFFFETVRMPLFVSTLSKRRFSWRICMQLLLRLQSTNVCTCA